MKYVDKCNKKFTHHWYVAEVFKTHLMKKCYHCKAKKWQARTKE